MKYTKYIGMAFAIATLAACSNDEDFTSAWQNDPAAVKVNATIGSGIFTRSNPTSDDATQQIAFNNGDKISIATEEQVAVTYTFDGTSTWAPETGNYLKWEKTAMIFTAFYPVTEGTDAKTFSLPTLQSDLAKIADADYMTFIGSKSNESNNELNLELSRSTARVIVRIAGFKNQYGGLTPSITETTIYSGAAGYAEGAASGKVTGVAPFIQSPDAGTVQINTTYTALVIPTAGSLSESFITMNVNSVALTVKGIPAMEAGNSYTYNLTIGKDAIGVESVTVDDWTGGTITGGEAVPKNFKSEYTAADYFNWDAIDPVNGANPDRVYSQDAKTQRFRDCPSYYEAFEYLYAKDDNDISVYWDDGFGTAENGLQTFSAPIAGTAAAPTIRTDMHRGIWLLKKKYHREVTPDYEKNSFNPPSINETNCSIRTDKKHFFLPLCGTCEEGAFTDKGWGRYWLSTSYNASYSYVLKFGGGIVQVDYFPNHSVGYLTWVAE